VTFSGDNIVVLFWVGLAVMCSVPASLFVLLCGRGLWLRAKYLPYVERIFQEKPLFIIPRGAPFPGAEQVRFRTADGLTLFGCYLKAPKRRRGVILFGLEFGSNCWSCRPYVEHLVENGFDVFAFESRNQGISETMPGYEPLQWVTDHEVRDTQAALAYLKGRRDADPRGVGLFGISKGAGAGLVAASRDPYVRCFVTDGAFATYSTLVPYMRQWLHIYHATDAAGLVPSWVFGMFGLMAMRRVGRQRHCRFPSLERAVRRLAPRPMLMIHGEADNYIKPAMARALFECARGPKELWIVEGAKHNQALQLVGEEYRRRVLSFFEQHLAGDHPSGPDMPSPAPSKAPCREEEVDSVRA
jgi:alpha-beta hydrolase superfamily lysophospholipase